MSIPTSDRDQPGSTSRLRTTLRSWLSPRRPEPEPGTAGQSRGAILVELSIVFAVTLGVAGLQSLLTLVDALLRTSSLDQQAVSINAPAATVGLVDLARQLTGILRLFAWGALGVYLLWLSGIRPARIGLRRKGFPGDLVRGAGLAALIGVPGLGLYLAAHAAGLNLAVQPSTLDDAWWRAPVLVLSALGNSFAEEALVVGYLLTRLRALGLGENRALWISAVLRGSYHLYQGFGGFVGNVVMGLVYGRVWQRTNRLWALVVGHALIDVVAFLGYALLRDRVGWLP
ncbi:CPBP family intramembrane glutamic endopeptidase [Actinopolyspora mortivallis]|uniref:CPBP family intramembrane metalloprotease n=1 Tax=Actinopolyspora mortivallis TaxID=33906 RepID=A0A2T0GW58_ACTMO|nr:type II CAAX endopeptidase family protein [Actinopolyspora mortivallis]PRW63350.1 CPBP family intramembrane metalloprotease [Actinopolyspora mortivallis]